VELVLGGVNKLKESRAHGDAYEVPAADIRGAQRSITDTCTRASPPSRAFY